MTWSKALSAGMSELGMAATTEQREKLIRYLLLLEKWNAVYNLTAVRKPEQMVSNHLLDSLSTLPYLWPKKWLDVGCGGGLPGIVLAIMRPDWSFTLLDSNSKKTGFVQQAAIELGLPNVAVVCARVESWDPKEKFDGIISRAFAEISDFVTVTRHLLAKDGHWVAMKGKPERELACLPQSVVIKKNIILQVPELKAARSLLILGVKE